MKKKIVIVGGVAGGASVAARLRRHSEAYEIVVFEKGTHISFSNCSLPYQISGVVPNFESLVMMTPERFGAQYNIDARTQQEVVAINRAAKTVTVRNVHTETTSEENYDVLVLSPGAYPIVPPILNLETIPTFTLRNLMDLANIKQHLVTNSIRNVTVIGAGYIGIEALENLQKAGYNATLIEAGSQILRAFDADMVQILHKELIDNNITVHLNEKVVAYENGNVVCDSGKKVPSDLVLMAIGVKPEIALAQSAGIQIGKLNGIRVNEYFQTNDDSIYAVGDAIEAPSKLLQEDFLLPLAGPTQKQARAVADHIHGLAVKPLNFIASSILQVFGFNAAATGLSEAMIQARKLDIQYASVLIMPSDKVSIMPDANPMFLKVVYETPSGRILGAQAVGKGNIDKRIDVIATVIKFNGTIHDLTELELCYAPPFGTAKDAVNFAGYVAENITENRYQQIAAHQVRALIEDNAYILDVRETREYDAAHLQVSNNIPLSELRANIAKIPKDRPIYVHCRSGQRSYNACLLLQQHGFKDVYNIAGGYAMICMVEYFTDTVTGRAPIVTKYMY